MDLGAGIGAVPAGIELETPCCLPEDSSRVTRYLPSSRVPGRSSGNTLPAASTRQRPRIAAYSASV